MYQSTCCLVHERQGRGGPREAQGRALISAATISLDTMLGARRRNFRRRYPTNSAKYPPWQAEKELKNMSFSSRWFCAEGPNCNPTGPLRGCRTRLHGCGSRVLEVYYLSKEDILPLVFTHYFPSGDGT